MAGFVSKQPNGLYCRFSTVVDCPTEGTEYNAIIDMPYNGIRLEVPGKKHSYTFPYHIDDIKKCFISAFDKERYDEIYTKVKNCKICIDSKCFDVGEAVIKQGVSE